MHSESSIFIQAPLDRVFELTSDLLRWPEVLPHYRYVRWLEGGPVSGVIEMAAMRGRIPVSWVSEFHADRNKPSLHFSHRSALTKGMEVFWDYEPMAGGVRVTIRHDLNFRFAPLAPLAERIIDGFFIEWVAPRTLATFRDVLEQKE